MTSSKPNKWLATISLRYFGFTRVPLIFFVRPSVVQIDERSATIKLPFRRRTKNHLGSMYFGAMSIEAELAGGILAFTKIKEQNQRISIIFKDFNAKFLKRAEGHTYFTCNDGLIIGELIQKAIESEERMEVMVHVTTTVPAKLGEEPVAVFMLTLSLKKN